MSELQWTLLLVGVGLVVGVWVFNRIQEWRWHRLAKKTLGSVEKDPLMAATPTCIDETDVREISDAERLDALHAAHVSGEEANTVPTLQQFDELDVAAELEALKQAQQSEPDDLPVLTETEAEAETRATPVPNALVTLQREDLTAPPDEGIEYLVPLGCTAPVTARALWHNLSRSQANVRGMRWLGRRVTDGGWSVLTPESEQRFDSLRAALLLASRSGPVSELDMERFCSVVSALATTMNLRVEFPPRNAALVRAAALDQFCAEVDVVVGINVVAVSGQTLSGGRIARWAEAHGMVLAEDGAYHLLTPQGASLWRLANRAPLPFTAQSIHELALAGVTFLLDVPMVESANEKLSPMFDAANILARDLGARVLDDNGQALGLSQLGRIERELAQMMLKMVAEDIPAGSSRARRLFSS
jgi:hypothetical protein